MKYLDLNYIFDASAQTVQITDWFSGTLKKEGVLLITNVETGDIIYRFNGGPGLSGTITPDAGGDIIALDFDTTSMNDTDALSIQYDDGAYPASENTLGAISSDISDVLNRLPTSIGQNAKANSLSVALASDQGALPVDGSGVTQPVSAASLPLPTGAATETTLAAIKTAVEIIDNFISGTKGLVTEDNSAAIKTAVETIDNFISGSRGLVTEDNSAAIKTAVETIDNFISGSRGLVTEDNSSAISSGIGATADAIVAAGAAGSLSAKLRRVTQGLEDLKTTIVLAAGSAAIGKLAANSGVDIGDVDVTSVPADPFGTNADAAVAAGATGSIQAKLRRATQGLEDLKTLIVLAAGTNLIGKVAAQHCTSAMSNGTTDVTPKFAKIDRATNADGAAVVSLVSAKKIRVLTLTLVSAGTVSIKWQSATSNSSGAGSNTDLTGLMSLVANTGVADVFSPVGLFETVAGEALKLNLNAAVQVSGYLTYLEI